MEGNFESGPSSAWERHSAWIDSALDVTAKTVSTIALGVIAARFVAEGMDTEVLSRNMGQITVSLWALGHRTTSSK